MRSIGLNSSKTQRTTLVCLICACLILSLTTDCFAKRRSKTIGVGISLLTTAALTGAGALTLHNIDDGPERRVNENHAGIAFALVLSGTILGPGAGHVYARRTGRMVFPAFVRGLGMLVFTWGAALGALDDDPGHQSRAGSGLLLATGVLIYFGAFAYDLFNVANSIDDYNGQSSRKADIGLKFNPERKQAMLMLTVPI